MYKYLELIIKIINIVTNNKKFINSPYDPKMFKLSGKALIWIHDEEIYTYTNIKNLLVKYKRVTICKNKYKCLQNIIITMYVVL